MSQLAESFIAIGSLLFLGLATDFIGKKTFLPRVTLLLTFGIIVGSSGLDFIPDMITERFEVITNIALLMIGFLLGGKLGFNKIKNNSSQIIWISFSAALGTAIIVTLVLFSMGLSLEIAILLGCISSATDAAATVETIFETKTDNPFSRLLLAIVAIDDAWALILFSFGLAFVSLLNSGDTKPVYFITAAYEILGAIVLGIIIGFPAAHLTGRLSPGQPMLTEALGLVFICGGVAMWLEVSFLIAAITMGAVIATFAKHHDYTFHEIVNVEWPFMVIFFILAGASLEINMLSVVGLTGIGYLIARASGKLLGAWLGATIAGSEQGIKKWMGMAMMSQAGVAIGMALLAANEFPEYRQTILAIVISSTVFFELLGPILLKVALKRAG